MTNGVLAWRTLQRAVVGFSPRSARRAEARRSTLKRAPLLALLAASTALAAVDGTVVNQTTGQPEPGASISLFRLSQNGPELMDSAKSDANGHFSINQTLEMGPHLIEVQHSGVTYNTMVPPGRPSTGLTLSVYDSSKDPKTAPISQHIVFLEPTGQQLNVTETYFFNNTGNKTYDDPDGGTLRFFVPSNVVKDSLKVNATEPRGMALEQAPSETKPKGAYSISFPVKPGETRVDINYTLPATDPEKYASKIYYQSGAPTRLVVPQSVSLQGSDLKSLGSEPQTSANIYETSASAYDVTVQGTGSLQAAGGGGAGASAGGSMGGGAAASSDDSDESGATLRTILPPAYEDRRVTILAITMAALALGFVLLYRKGQAAPVKGKTGS